MELEHEYALLGGMNRAKVGRYLSIAAAGISALVMLGVLALWNVAKALGLPSNIPPSILSLIGAGTVFTVLYWFINNYAWRWAPLGGWLKAPDLSGAWACEGSTLNLDGSTQYNWSGRIVIIQSWEKIRVRLKTSTSGSNSIAAALLCDEADGFRLLYNYRNDPKLGQPDLQSHCGFTDLVFSHDLQSAEGEYFNGQGRYTFGTMRLTREDR
ncbi:hypothetical protein AD945_01085 [Gluconobacter albidus]|uniref:Uncharacterized protein n=1 Tax=Gluconobacter albidus TaxID=318683 RepID=A0A149TN70_9PROT|nr:MULTISPECIES: hypothetical protein [Gluconobacter]KXV50874.1 hypothetical protein AD945_01085 [Gluconobacter albidus]